MPPTLFAAITTGIAFMILMELVSQFDDRYRLHDQARIVNSWLKYALWAYLGINALNYLVRGLNPSAYGVALILVLMFAHLRKDPAKEKPRSGIWKLYDEQPVYESVNFRAKNRLEYPLFIIIFVTGAVLFIAHEDVRTEWPDEWSLVVSLFMLALFLNTMGTACSRQAMWMISHDSTLWFKAVTKTMGFITAVIGCFLFINDPEAVDLFIVPAIIITVFYGLTATLAWSICRNKVQRMIPPTKTYEQRCVLQIAISASTSFMSLSYLSYLLYLS